MASVHGAVDRRQAVVLDHDVPPYGDGEGEPDADVVDHDGEVGVEQVERRPPPTELLLLVQLVRAVVAVEQERKVLQLQQDVRNGDT